MIPQINIRVGMPFIWKAETLKGELSSEYEFSSLAVCGYVETKFNQLDQSKVAKFWLDGVIKLGFSALTGSFFIEDAKGSVAEIAMKLGRFSLTKGGGTIIQTKDCAAYGSFLGHNYGSRLESQTCGYEWVDSGRKVKILASVVGNNRIVFLTHLTWDADYEGNLIINGVKNEVKLEKGKEHIFPMFLACN